MKSLATVAHLAFLGLVLFVVGEVLIWTLPNPYLGLIPGIPGGWMMGWYGMTYFYRRNH